MNEEIEKKAREKWIKAGRPEGKDLEFWLEAEKELELEVERTDKELNEYIIGSKKNKDTFNWMEAYRYYGDKYPIIWSSNITTITNTSNIFDTFTFS